MTKNFKEYARYSPVHTAKRSTEIPERQLPFADTVGPFPGKENIHPVRELDKQWHHGQ